MFCGHCARHSPKFCFLSCWFIPITKGCECEAQAHPVSNFIWNMRALSESSLSLVPRLSLPNLARATHFVRNLEKPREGDDGAQARGKEQEAGRKERKREGGRRSLWLCQSISPFLSLSHCPSVCLPFPVIILRVNTHLSASQDAREGGKAGAQGKEGGRREGCLSRQNT